MRDSVVLYPYQEDGRNFILTHLHVLIGDEMGLGKSVQAISVMEQVIGQVVVVCPASLRDTWRKEIDKFTTLDGVHIVSYEGLKKIPDLGPIGMVVYDEAHYLKNLQAKRTQEAHKFVRQHKPKYCVLLTGTPIRNAVGDFYSLLKLLTTVPGVPNGLAMKEKSLYTFNLEYSNVEYQKIFVRGGGTKSVASFSGIRNKMDLKMLLKHKYIRRTAAKVLSLPPMTISFVDLSNGKNPDAGLYDSFVEWLETGKLTKHITHMKMTAAMAKVAYTVPFVKNMVEQGEQVVVFTDHVDPALTLVKGLASPTCAVGLISGSVSAVDRIGHIDDFQSGKIKVLVCTIGAAGIGITLTASRTIVFNDISWVAADIQQAQKRIHRIGQDKPCIIYHVTQGSFDEMIQKIILEKAALMKEIL